MALMSRMTLALAAFCGMAWGQTTLTTIQDTLFKADGTLYNGTLVINWVTFDLATGGTVVQQSTSVSVVNGNLLVQLTPSAGAQPPANVYTVNYESDGLQQFTETWIVPVSSVPLTVAEVRVGTTPSSGGSSDSGSGSSGPIAESAVTNLVADLGQRPVKGVGFTTDGVAIIDDNGLIETAVGSPGDCVLVDGSTGPCGQPQPTFVDAETPGGVINGTNTTFTLANLPSGSSLMLFRNGIYMQAGFDYTLTGSSIQFVSAEPPQLLDTLVASYRVGSLGSSVIGGGSGGSVVTTSAQVLCSAAGASTQATTFVNLGGCNVPAAAMQPGDRIQIQFNFTHTGTAGGFEAQVTWGTTTVLDRVGGTGDSAFTGQANAAITSTGAQLSVQSWGSVLSFLPGIVTSPVQSGLRIALNGQVRNAADTLTLSNFTVVRFPAN